MALSNGPLGMESDVDTSTSLVAPSPIPEQPAPLLELVQGGGPQGTPKPPLAPAVPKRRVPSPPLQGAAMVASKRDPQQWAKVTELADRTGLQPDFVARNWEELSRADGDRRQVAAMSDVSPTFASWLEDPDNATLAKHEMPALSQVDQGARLLTPAKDEDHGFFSDVGGATATGMADLGQSTGLLAAAFGHIDPKRAATFISDMAQRGKFLREQAPDYRKEYLASSEKHAGDVNKAWQDYLASSSNTERGTIRNALEALRTGGATIGEALSLIGAAATRLRGLGYGLVESLASMTPIIAGAAAVGVAGRVAGAVGGGEVGFLVGGPLGGAIGATVGGTVGGIGGGMAGTFAGAAPLNVGAEVAAEMQKRGIDLTDPAQVERALSDPKLMEMVRQKAIAGGVTSAAVMSLVAGFGGAMSGAAERAGAGTALKVAAKAGDATVQAVGVAAGGEAGAVAKAVGDVPGLLVPGNIDVSNRPPVMNADGSVSTVRSISIEENGKTILIPTVIDGRVVSDAEAITHYDQTDQHLGIFADEKSANAYAAKLHQAQAEKLTGKGSGKPAGASFGEALGAIEPGRALSTTLEMLGFGLASDMVGAGRRKAFHADPIEAAKQVAGSTTEALRAAHDAQALSEIGAAVKAAETTASLPDRIKSLVETATGGREAGTVFFQSAEWDKYWQSQGASPAKAAADILGDGGKAYHDAQTTGAAMAIPLADYVARVGPTPHFEGLLDVARMKADGMSLGEAHQYLTELPATMKGIADEASVAAPSPEEVERLKSEQRILRRAIEEYRGQYPLEDRTKLSAEELQVVDDRERENNIPATQRRLAEVDAALERSTKTSASESAVRVGQDVETQLKAAGVPATEARAQAKVYESAFRVMGERTGKDPEELYRQYGLRIGREGTPASAESPALQKGEARIAHEPLPETEITPLETLKIGTQKKSDVRTLLNEELPAAILHLEKRIRGAEQDLIDDPTLDNPGNRASIEAKRSDIAKIQAEIARRAAGGTALELPFSVVDHKGRSRGRYHTLEEAQAALKEKGLTEATVPQPVTVVPIEEVMRTSAAEPTRTTLNQSATIARGTESLEKYGLESGQKYTRREIAVALETRQREKYGTIAPDDRSPEARNKIAKWMVAEIAHELDHPEGSGIGWYTDKFQAALDAMGERFPELKTDQTARDLMTALIAVTSDGAEVSENFQMAMGIYEGFKANGTFEMQQGHNRQASIRANLIEIQHLHSTLGEVGMRNFLLEEKPIRELKKVAKAMGREFDSDYQAHITMPMAAIAFGPKLGAFYANLMGRANYLTMDRWWSRTFNRYRGTLLQAPTAEGLKRFKELVGKPRMSDDEAIAAVVPFREDYKAKGYKNGTELEKAANTIYKAAYEELEDTPFNASDRTFMLDTVERAQQLLKKQGHDISKADLQAILWYYEKKLYGQLSGKSSRTTVGASYEEAAQALVRGNAGSDRLAGSAPEGAGRVAPEGAAAVREGAAAGEPAVFGDERAAVASAGEEFPAAPSPKEAGRLAAAEGIRTLEQSGTRRATPATESPEFKAWFGKSKVVDEDGKPLVVYHGTNADFKAFRSDYESSVEVFWAGKDLNFHTHYFSDAESVAATYGETIVPVYLSIEKPKIINARGQSWDDFSPFGKIADAVATGQYDGVIIRNIRDEASGAGDTPSTVYVAFAPEQIKSATGNSGAFDQLSPNIYEQAARGRITFGEDRTFNIDLLKKADRSTFLHETGHFYLEVLQDLAKQPGAAPDLVADHATIMQWLGAEEGNPLTTEQHEQFARGFEAYLMEGKAPSSALRATFYRFRNWLIGVYEHLTALKVDLTPEVRGVFDRLLATKEEIAAEEQRQQAQPLFTDPRAVGMTEEQAARYGAAVAEAHEAAEEQLSTKMLKDIQREQSTEWKAWRDPMRAEIEAQVNARPEYKALAYLQKHEHPDGTPLPEGTPLLKLNRESITATYGAEFAARLPRGILATTEKGGTNASVIADMFGFANGRELVNALLNAGPRKTLVEFLTDQRMQAEHGERPTAPEIQEAAKEAVRGGAKREQLLRMELENIPLSTTKGMIRAVTRVVPPAAETKAQADRIVGDTRVRDVRPDLFGHAADRAGKEALEAFLKGDFDAAFAAKRQQVLATAVYDAAVRAKDTLDSALDDFKQVFGSDKRLEVTRDLAFINGARALLSQFGIGSSSKGAEAYLEMVREYAPDVYDNVQAISEDVRALGISDYKQLTVTQFNELAKTVQQLWVMSRKARQITLDGQTMDIEQALEPILEEVTARTNERTATRGQKKQLDLVDRLANFALGAEASMRRVESWAREIDGLNPLGPMSRVVRAVLNATNKYRLQKTEVGEKLAAATKALKDLPEYHDIVAPELGGYAFKNRAELLGAMLHTGNADGMESNLVKLLVGRNWGSIDESGALDRTKWDAFVRRMQQEKILTKADYDWLQAAGDFFEALKPQLQASYYEVNGRYMKEVTHTPFTTPFGDYAGWYYPAIGDTHVAGGAEIENAMRNSEDALLGVDSKFLLTQPASGMTKTRTGKTWPLVMDATQLPRHLDAVLKYIHMAPVVREAFKVMNHRDFREAMAGVNPSMVSDALIPFLRAASSQRAQAPETTTLGRAFANSINYVKNGAMQQVVGANLVILVEQALHTSALQSMRTADNKAMVYYHDVAGAAARIMLSPKKLTEMIHEASPTVQSRDHTRLRKAEVAYEAIMDPSALRTVQEVTAHGINFVSHLVNALMDKSVWLGSYDRAIQRGYDVRSARDIADAVVRQGLGGHNPEDIAEIQRGTALTKAMLGLYSFFNSKANQLGTDAFAKTMTDMGLRRSKTRMAAVYVFGLLALSMSGAAARDLIGGKKKKDDETWTDVLAEWAGWGQLEAAARFVPGGNVPVQAVKMFAHAQGASADNMLSSPAANVLANFIGTARAAHRSLTGETLTSKDIKDVLGLFGTLMHLPLKALSRPISYQMDVNQGKAAPSGPIDAARGYLTGQRGR